MKICLSEFRYYFSLRGNSGGLHSINMVFKPLYTEGQEPGDLKTEVRHFIDLYMVVLDTLYEDFIDGEKEPMLQDSPYRVDSGYRYIRRVAQEKTFYQ